MTAILGILVFVLVQGCAMCSELYPISIFKDFSEDQKDYDNKDTEPPQGKTLVPPKPSSVDITWIVTRIVNGKYGFVIAKIADVDVYVWKTLPTFDGPFLNPQTKEGQQFILDGNDAETFFKKNNDWNELKKRPCLDLLYITAARYLFVTKILYEQSGKKLKPCVKRTYAGFEYEIPQSGVCFPAPYGSATCTSDYDVGLIGKDSGILTKNFNDYFEATFKKPSEVVFDTNIYAFTLEFAMPLMFVFLKPKFVLGVQEKEKAINWKMQELASALFKVKKYNEGFYKILVDKAVEAMAASVPLNNLNKWLTFFDKLKVPLRVEDFNGPVEFRRSHNAMYQEYVKTMSQNGGYKAEFIGNVAQALMYAAEAYHTRGAIRHVVGGTQMKVLQTSEFSKDLSTNDLWVSMIENWGESIKEYNHNCNAAVRMGTCFLKMSKYMWRMLNAMRMLFARIPTIKKGGPTLTRFGAKTDPEALMNMWLRYKRKGAAQIPNEVQNIKSFLNLFGCNKAVEKVDAVQLLGLPMECLAIINNKVNDYNIRLAAILRVSGTFDM